MFSIKKVYLVLALCGVMITAASAQGNCEKCMDNSAYCVDETHFRICLDGQNPSMTDGPHECPAGTFCTNSADICAKENPPTIVKGCSSVSSDDCSICSGRFACVSKTEFALCQNNQLTSIITSCKSGEVCSIDLFKNQTAICAAPAVLEFLGYRQTCSNLKATTAVPPTTPNRSSLQQQCESAKPSHTNRFFFIRNADDTTCRTFLYCETIDNVMDAVLFTCKTGYFDIDSLKCVETKPKDC